MKNLGARHGTHLRRWLAYTKPKWTKVRIKKNRKINNMKKLMMILSLASCTSAFASQGLTCNASGLVDGIVNVVVTPYNSDQYTSALKLATGTKIDTKKAFYGLIGYGDLFISNDTLVDLSQHNPHRLHQVIIETNDGKNYQIASYDTCDTRADYDCASADAIKADTHEIARDTQVTCE
jgi:hypothetical protein